MLGATIVLGLVLGMRHALEPDHLSAVSTLLAGGHGGARRGAWLGLVWGAGHAGALALVAGVLAWVGVALPRPVADLFELLVGVMLLALGVQAIASAGAEHAHAGPAAHVHLLRRPLATRALLVGVVHGLAGSGMVTALVAARLPSAAARVAYVVLFGAGSALGMATLSGLCGWPLARLGRGLRARRVMAACAGALSIVVGTAWLGAAAGCIR